MNEPDRIPVREQDWQMVSDAVVASLAFSRTLQKGSAVTTNEFFAETIAQLEAAVSVMEGQ